MNDRLQALSDAGVSIWLDDLSRERIESGNLSELIAGSNVVGVTTNPTIFAKALSDGERYNEQVRELVAAGADVETAVFELTTRDVQEACDLMLPVFDRTGGVDGRVSIEVEPALAHDTEATIRRAKELHDKVARPNLLVKIPATREGVAAIEASIAAGISINVTLIFALQRHREVIDAYLSGVERAKQAGLDISTIHSVASFFVSRVDTEIDKRLEAIGSDEALALRGKAAVANARLAFELYQQEFSAERGRALLTAGANTQRPLWASTGVKDPDYPDTMYVDDLIAKPTVNTMPEATLRAVADHGKVLVDDTVSGTYDESRDVLERVAAVGISYDEVVQVLEDEGVEKFDKSWAELETTVASELEKGK
ncbi:transaldolase [Solicola gregarius]|uniref:Transaldolase n=1 Tax=Solicola gregarius TaxID=2908642 RepID=A0AA46YJS9_9ACTN|nr:transaldolase [Solicola gregarius]UYM04905.1 transaldolase [Solicola gregarius]